MKEKEPWEYVDAPTGTDETATVSVVCATTADETSDEILDATERTFSIVATTFDFLTD